MKKRKGFSLIEIIVVLTVIGVLASTAVVTYQRSKQRSQYRAMRANVRVLTDAVKSYFYTLQSYCVTSTTGRTNRAYGTQLHDANFCRYRVYVSWWTGQARVRVQYYRRGAYTGPCTGWFYYNVDGDQLFCFGSDCISG